jgi:TRAP-type C4-dicarboxylate transport system permease small subunit
MDSLKKAIAKVSFGMNQIAKWSCIIFLGLLVVDVFVEVIMRYVFVKPMVFGEQLADYLMIWLAFMAASVGIRKAAHMGLDTFVKKMPETAQKGFSIVTQLLVVTFLVLLTYWGFVHAFAVRLQKSPVVFNISMMIPYLAIPVGAIFMLVQEIGVMVNGPVLVDGNEK